MTTTYCADHAPQKPENLRYPDWWIACADTQLRCDHCAKPAEWVVVKPQDEQLRSSQADG